MQRAKAHNALCEEREVILAALDNVNGRLLRPRRRSPAALDRLVGQEWPGNVRSPMNVVERTAQLTPGELIDSEDLQLSDDGRASSAGLPEPHIGFDVQASLDAARRLNVTPQDMSKFLKKAGL
jgi:DNA-binding NtrC family response regulator